MDIYSDYQPEEKACLFHESDKMYRGLIGGMGSGKTRAGNEEALQLAKEYPGINGLLGAPTFPQLRDTTLKSFLEDRGDGKPVCDPRLIKSYERSKQRITLWNGSQIYFRSLDVPERLKGLNLGFFYIDEASDVKVESFEFLQSRLRQPGIPYLNGFITTNPDSTWVDERFIAGHELFFRIHVATKENPHNPPGYLANLEAAFSGEDRIRYIDGQFAKYTGLVYKNFDANVHVVKPFRIPNSWRKIRAIDFGYTNPFCCLWLAQDPITRTWYIYNEYYMPGRTMDIHQSVINDITGSARIDATYADHQRQDRAELEKGNRGIATIPAKKSIVAGISYVRSLFNISADTGLPGLMIFDRCVNFLKEIAKYQYPKVKNGVASEIPIDKFNHALDSGRYGLFTEADVNDDPRIFATRPRGRPRIHKRKF